MITHGFYEFEISILYNAYLWAAKEEVVCAKNKKQHFVKAAIEFILCSLTSQVLQNVSKADTSVNI